jgi:PAS domain S-box-containing protein
MTDLPPSAAPATDSRVEALFLNLTRKGRSWRLILDTALDAVVVMNCTGAVADWNERATETFGFTREEVIGRNMAELIIPPGYRAAHQRGIQRFLQTGQETILGRRIEISALRKNGEEFPVELSIAPVSDDDELVFIGFLRDISERKRTEEHQKFLLAELSHRVKNMLAVVTGIASQTARHSTSVAAFTDAFFARLQALSRAHSLLAEGNWRSTPLRKLVDEILSPYAALGVTPIALDGPSVELKPKSALAVGMILHELVTNAAKYGALATRGGKLVLRWEYEAGPVPVVHLHWRESGVGPLSPPQHPGFGSTMIQTSARHDLGGEVKVTYGPDGMEYDLSFPLTRVNE